MPPKSYVMQQLMKQMGGSTAPTTISEPDFMSRDFRPMDFSDSPPSNTVPRNSGNPVMDLAQIMYQGGVGDTRGTGGMPDSANDPLNYTELANPPMETGSFRRVPRPVYDSYTEELNYGRGMAGGGSNDIPFYNAKNIVEQSMPNMQIRSSNPQMNLPNLVGNDYPDNPTPSFRQDVLPPQDTLDRTKTLQGGIADTETAYQESLPGSNVAQAFRDREIKRQEEEIKKQNDAIYQQGLKDNPFLSQEESLEDFLPRDYRAEAGQVASGIANKTGEIAGKTAKTAGFLGRGLAKMGGSALNSLLYGNTDKGLFDNLNQTLYGGEKSFRENMFNLPPAQSNTAETGSMRDIVKKHVGSKPSKPTGGGFKSAFAAARKSGKKTFKWKNPRTGKTIEYTTALASDKKKAKSGKDGNVSDFMEQILGNKNNDPSALEGSFRRVKPGRSRGVSYYGGRY